MDIKEIISKIKRSKKYQDISEEVIKQSIEDYTKGKSLDFFDEDILIKDIKSRLHRAHSSFQSSTKTKKEREKLLTELEQDPQNLQIIDSLLETNNSTKERLQDYREIYKEIFYITGKPKRILDLGCGLNPLSFYYMDLHNFSEYYAYDINDKDKEFIERFFKIIEINGKSETLDLSKIENIKKLENADICFMFKLVDVLEENKEGHKYSEDLIKILIDKCKYLVVSFPTKTISGKKMNYPQRGWIEWMTDRIGLKFKGFETDNEIFYIISKK